MRRQNPVTGRLAAPATAGEWKIIVRAPGQQPVDVSTFRGVVSLPDAMSFDDPFGPKDLSITFPTIGVFERLGEGDLAWLPRKGKASIDVVWNAPLSPVYPHGYWHHQPRVHRPSFAWEGAILGYGFTSGDGLSVTARGALYQLDDYLCKPEYWARPVPYEHAIARQFNRHVRPHLRLSPMQVIWPSWWTTTFHRPAKGTPYYLHPAGVHDGDLWTALLTRNSGAWDPALSSYIQTLANGMYTRRGRWTLDLDRGRVPVLFHRDMLARPDASTIRVDVTSRLVAFENLSVDWSQSIDVAYAQGTSLLGVAYSGMNISADGSLTSYSPAAALRQAHPIDDDTGWLDLAQMPREVMLTMQPGLDEYDAQKVAAAHLERFGDPGITGDLILTGDVQLSDGTWIPHHLVRAGASLQLAGLWGRPEGALVHAVSSTTSFTERSTRVSFDSRYRDALTVREVKIRGRDSLAINRMLVGGGYTPPIPDQLLPWDYATGSGMIPSGKFNSAVPLFRNMPDSVQFPWTDWTTRHPPSTRRWQRCYVRIGPASSNADKNWSGHHRAGGVYGIPVKMSQAGAIRLIQVAAYNADGTLAQVPFHLSLYYMSGVNVKAMPKIPGPTSGYPPYAVGQHYPWVASAWEERNLDGTLHSTDVPIAVRSAGLWKAYGVDPADKAGYWPHEGSGDPTGLLDDETVQSFDTTAYGGFNQYLPPGAKHGNHAIPEAGMMYVMIYCDAQSTQPVYFLGRMFRVEPGANIGAGGS